MIKIISIDGLACEEIEDLLNKNSDWQLVSFGTNTYHTRGTGWGGPPPRDVPTYFMAVKPIVENPKDFEE